MVASLAIAIGATVSLIVVVGLFFLAADDFWTKAEGGTKVKPATCTVDKIRVRKRRTRRARKRPGRKEAKR